MTIRERSKIGDQIYTLYPQYQMLEDYTYSTDFSVIISKRNVY